MTTPDGEWVMDSGGRIDFASVAGPPCTCGPGPGRDAQGRDPDCRAGQWVLETIDALQQSGRWPGAGVPESVEVSYVRD